MNAKIRIIALIAFAALLVSPFASFAKEKDEARMTVKETSHDFGVVKEDGGPVSCEFEFTNDGGSNLVIFSATAQCGCTRPDFPKQPIAPGKSGVIKVTYNPLGRPGAFEKMVTVKTNGKPAKLRLKIKGTVMPGK